METGTVTLSLGHPLGVLAPGLDSLVQGDQALDTGGSSQMDMAVVAWRGSPLLGLSDVPELFGFLFFLLAGNHPGVWPGAFCRRDLIDSTTSARSASRRASSRGRGMARQTCWRSPSGLKPRRKVWRANSSWADVWNCG